MKRRLFCGIREVLKKIKLRKLRCVIVAPNIEQIVAPGRVADGICKCSAHCFAYVGGLDSLIGQILTAARENDVDIVFALSRNRMGRAMKRVRRCPSHPFPHRADFAVVFLF